MRLFAYVAALIALGAAALAGQALWGAVRDPVPPRSAPVPTAAPDPAAEIRAEEAVPRDWPALFGAPVVPEPQPPRPPAPVGAPQPPAPPAPPITGLGYVLQGVVSEGANRWAIVSHPTGEQLIRVGDRLGEIYTVTAIDGAGLWGRSSPGAEAQLLGFAK